MNRTTTPRSLRITLAALVVPVLLVSACATQDDGECITDRRLAANGVSVNRLAANGLLAEVLPTGALTSDAIAGTLDADALSDAGTLEVLEYAVSCALSPEQQLEVVVDGRSRTLAGGLGLAPQWGREDGVCDAACQGWVSACLIARTNFFGESRSISLLGDNAGLEPSAEESREYDLEEATYYGGLFGDDKTMYACLPDGADAPERTCGGEAEGCPIEIVGSCADLCDAAGCRNARGEVFAQTITVHLADAGC